VWDDVGAVRVRGRVNPRALARDASAPHVVLVHGLGMATDYLEPTMRALGEDVAVSALDLPGFGGSRQSVVGYRSLDSALRAPLGMTEDVIPSERSESRDLHSNAAKPLTDLANALVAWLRVRRISAPVLVGQSHGCQVVVEAVTRAPEVASALMLNAPTMLAEHRSVVRQLWLVARDTPREPLSLVPHVVRDYLKAGPVRILATLRDALRDRIEEKLAGVRVPVTVVTGERDPLSPPAWCERLVRAAGSGARLVVIPGAAHAVPFSHPKALAAEILVTVQRLEAVRAQT
jgi:2-hydroxy-6-oxonona-2,4-dienedioate hydrolase